MEGSVLGSRILPTILIMAPVAAVLTAQTSWSEPAAEECITRPTAITPRGEHWYYRINHAKQHCWYLGKLEGHKSARNMLSAHASEPTPQPGNIADTQDQSTGQSAAPPPPVSTGAPVTGVQPTPVPATTTLAPSAPMLAASPAPAAAVPPPPAAAPGPGFTTRWPDNLPTAEDASQAEPAISAGNAGGREAADTTAQQVSSPPGATAEQAAGTAAADTALRYFSIAGMLAIPLVLAVGFGAKYARRRPQSSPSADVWRQVANREAASRQAASRELANRQAASRQRRRESADAEDFSNFNRVDTATQRNRIAGICDLDRLAADLSSREPLAELWRGDAHTSAPTPTDPADDLKTSLAELMRDLRRAGAFAPEEPTPAHHTDAERVAEHAREPVQDHDLAEHDAASPAHHADAQEPVQGHVEKSVQDHGLAELGLAQLERDADAQDHLQEHDPEQDPDYCPVLEAAE
jgi:hypothetical protein